MLVPMELQCLEKSAAGPKSLVPTAERDWDQKHQSAFFSGKPAIIMPLSRISVGSSGKWPEEDMLEEEEGDSIIGISASVSDAAAA